MYNDFQERSEKLENQIFHLIGSLAKGKPGISANFIPLFPEIDELIYQQDKFFKNRKTDISKPMISKILQTKLDSFLNGRSVSIMKMYTKTIEAYMRSMDYLNSRIDTASISLKKSIFNSKVDLQGVLQDTKDRLETELKAKEAQLISQLEAQKSKTKETDSELKRRYEQETQRLTDHFEKMLTQRIETLTLTSSSLKKAQEDLAEVTQQREAEIRSIVSKNNETLEKHSESMLARVAAEEQKAIDLEQEFNEVFKANSALGPELSREWREKNRALKDQYEAEDIKYADRLRALTKAANAKQEEVDEAKNNAQIHRAEYEENLDNQRKVFEKNIQAIIEQREEYVENAKKVAEDSWIQKEKKLLDNLAQLREQCQKDIDAMKLRLSDKSGAHKDRKQLMKEQHEESMAEMEKEIQKVKDKQEEVREEWTSEKKKLELNFEQDLKDIKQKSELEQKFFNSKINALTQELHAIQTENQKVEHEEDIVVSSRLEMTVKEMHDKEIQFANKLKSEFQEKIDAAVQEKILELRKKHEKEKLLLIQEVNNLTMNEANLSKNLANIPEESIPQPIPNSIIVPQEVKKPQLLLTVSNKNPTSAVHQLTIVSKKSTSRGSNSTSRNATGRVAASFASMSFVDSQLDKWREDFYVDVKNLKQEEAVAMKTLDVSKHEFQAAVERATALRQRLESTTIEYTKAIEEAKGKNEEELGLLLKVIEKKEKEVTQLENLVAENEAELKKRVRQIETNESKLENLRQQFNDEKQKIHDIIKKEYQPIIQQEQKKSESMVVELEKLRSEMELSIEYMQQDLYIAETSNAAMEESLRQETNEMVMKLKGEMLEEMQYSEKMMQSDLNSEEIDKLERVNQEVSSMELEELALEKRMQEEIKVLEAQQKVKIMEVNDYCIDVISSNSDLKKIVIELENRKCEKCPVLKKNEKKLEKEIVKLQMNCRDIMLESQNNKEVFKVFRPKKVLPPIPV